MSIKDCGHHKDHKKERLRRIFAGVLIFLFVVLLVILIIWAVLRPAKPKLILQDATVYGFNLTGSTLLTSVFQVTVQSRNPNDKIGIYYDRLVTYATYNDQQITLPTGIPPTYQDTKGMNIWSPYLQGQKVPIAPYIGMQIEQARSMGTVQLVIKMDGRVRFRVGSFVSGSYRIHVNCPAIIPFGNDNAGVMVGNNAIKYQLIQNCDVSV